MKNMGLIHYYLVVEVNQIPRYIFISKIKYIGELLNRFGMKDCNPLSTSMEHKLKLKLVEENHIKGN